jgi:integrase/recombinase XerD
VLAIPTKRCDRAEVTYLVQAEADAVLAAPDRRTWTGRRDHALLDIALQTGLRASELTGLRNQDVELSTGAYVQCWGKGRKQRCTPLSKQTVAVLRAWMRERRGQPNDPLVPDPPRHTAHPGRDDMPYRQTRRHRATTMPVTARQTANTSRPQTFLRHAAIAIRG